MNKKICDMCGKEIKDYGYSLLGSRWALFGILPLKTINADFCSLECLFKFVKKLKGDVEAENKIEEEEREKNDKTIRRT